MSKRRIIIADHEKAVADMVAALLNAEGFDSLAVNSSANALSEAKTRLPDILIIDPIMPGLSGVEVASQIARESICKVIFLTTLAGDRDFKDLMRGLREQGINCTALAKPINEQELIRIVTREAAALSSTVRQSSSPTNAGRAGSNLGAAAVPAPVEALEREYQPLLEICTPYLYQDNAFRLTGFAVESSLRDISREAERVEVATKIGMAHTVSGPFSLSVDHGRIKASLQVLKDPEKRLLHEFFWFWPCADTSKTDVALTALQHKNYQRAVDVWRAEVSEDKRAVASHNLAVFYHLRALDLELAKTGRSDTLWGNAYEYWNKVINHHGFWDKLLVRIKSLNDPRVSPSLAQQIWISLPFAMLSISAQLAVAAARAGNFEDAGKHRKIMAQAGLDEALCRQGLQKALYPLREEITNLCNQAEAEARAKPEEGAVVARRLFDDKRPLLQCFNYLLGSGDRMRDDMHDLVAQTARSCIVANANHSENWETIRVLLEECLALAEGNALRARLEEDLEVVAGNIEGKKAAQRAKAAANPHVQPAGSPVNVAFLVVVTVSKGCNDSPAPQSPSGSTYTSPPSTDQSTTTDTQYAPNSYASSTQLKTEIEANRARIAVLEMDLRSDNSRLDSLKSEIEADRFRLEQLKRDNESGLQVDETEYEGIRNRHNSNIDDYNSLIPTRNNKLSEYRQLLQKTNADIDRYNELVRRR
jgi:CheY-like chemotaxis protein